MIGRSAAELIPGYAQNGLPVFPLHTAENGVCSCGWDECHSPGKHPRLGHAHRKGDPLRGTCRGECGRVGHGVYDATTDLTTIALWLGRWPDTNWGGHIPPGVIVLDIDPRNGGDETLAELEARYNPLPSTLAARTGSGGSHYWFSYKGLSRGKLGPGIDVKKAGGYVVLPPSVHSCGGAYRWTNHAPAAPAPRWLQLKLNPPVSRSNTPVDYSSGGTDRLAKFISEAPEGERNNRLFWACCRAVEAGVDMTPLIDAAESIGLNRLEATATAMSAEHAPSRKAAQ